MNAFVHEVDDGYDTIQWITEQPWSNGDVGMWGDSYYGYTQWAAVASGHPALKAIVPRVTVADLFGWLDGDGVAPLYGAHYLAQYWSDGRTHHWTPDWTRRPLSELFDPAFELIGSRSLAFDRLLAEAGGQPPVDMYGDRHPFTLLRIPTLHGVGWFDNITPPHMLDYERLMSDPETAPFQYLHAGSTDHENYRFEFVPIPESEDHDTHDDALERMLPRYLAPALDFFDAFLAGRSDPESVPRVRWHLPNVGWRESPVWPPAGAREQRLHLTEAGGLSEAETGEGAVEWLHDPENLVPSTIENPFAFLYEYPDEDAVASRPDVAVFESADLDDHLTLAGRVVAHLTVAGDGPSMNLHVKLIDVDPTGGSHVVLYGQRAVDNPTDGTAAEVYLGHTGYRLPAGHRLRLQVASSDYPLYVAHPGTSQSPWFATRTAVNHQRLLTGGATPSHLSVTVLDECSWAGSVTLWVEHVAVASTPGDDRGDRSRRGHRMREHRQGHRETVGAAVDHRHPAPAVGFTRFDQPHAGCVRAKRRGAPRPGQGLRGGVVDDAHRPDAQAVEPGHAPGAAVPHQGDEVPRLHRDERLAQAGLSEHDPAAPERQDDRRRGVQRPTLEGRRRKLADRLVHALGLLRGQGPAARVVRRAGPRAVAGCRLAAAQEPRQPDHVGCAGAADDPAGGHGRVLLRCVRLALPAQTARR